MKKSTIRYSLVLASLLLWTGCGKDAPAPNADAANQSAANSPAASPEANASRTVCRHPSPAPKIPSIKPLTLGALGGGDSSTGGQDQSKSAAGKDTMNSVLDAMKPLQIFLGEWNTTTRNMGAGSAKWIWDFRTDRKQPALVMSTKDHPVF